MRPKARVENVQLHGARRDAGEAEASRVVRERLERGTVDPNAGVFEIFAAARIQHATLDRAGGRRGGVTLILPGAGAGPVRRRPEAVWAVGPSTVDRERAITRSFGHDKPRIRKQLRERLARRERAVQRRGPHAAHRIDGIEEPALSLRGELLQRRQRLAGWEVEIFLSRLGRRPRGREQPHAEETAQDGEGSAGGVVARDWIHGLILTTHQRYQLARRAPRSHANVTRALSAAAKSSPAPADPRRRRTSPLAPARASGSRRRETFRQNVAVRGRRQRSRAGADCTG